MEEMLDDFYIEAQELIEEAEVALLDIENGESFDSCFNALFRSFHSLKGAAGMFDLILLQKHMHYLEDLLDKNKKNGEFSNALTDYLLKGVDAAKEILKGNEIEFAPFEEGDSPQTTKAENSEAKVETATEKKAEVEVEKKVDVASEKKEASVVDKRSKVIFLTDDEEGILEILTDIFEEQGFRVESFLNPEDLIKRLEDVQPDCIISDFRMPQMTGLEVIQKAHQMHPLLPTVLLSGHLDTKTCIESIASGAQGIMEKPFDDELLLKTVGHVVKRYQSVKILNQSMNLFLYQFSELSDFLKTQNKTDLLEDIKVELHNIIEARKNMMSMD